MGKNIIQQKRGKGSLTYRAPSHRYKGKLTHRPNDELEKNVVKGKVVDLLHCPGHGAPVASVEFENKEKILMAAPENIKVGDTVASGNNAPLLPGNTLPLKNIPTGTFIYNIEAQPGDGGKFVRAAGTFARVVLKLGDTVNVELPSKKQRAFNAECRATIGIIAGGGKKEKPFLKAGKKWHAMSARNRLFPHTSGVAMNAVNHPFGCGRGRHPGKPKTVPRTAPPGRKVGLVAARRTGRRK